MANFLNASCGSCEYWVQNPVNAQIGWCHGVSPIAALSLAPVYSTQVQWPQVSGSDWCGQYVAIPAPPQPVMLPMGESVVLTATFTDSHGVTCGPPSGTITWTTSNSAIANTIPGSPSTTCTVQAGNTLGTATITATIGSLTASVPVTLTSGVAANMALSSGTPHMAGLKVSRK